MTAVFLLLFFLFGLGFFGWQICRSLLKINRPELLLPLSAVVSYGIYIFFLNIVSYFIPIGINFYLLFFILLGSGICFFYFDKSRERLSFDLGKKQIFLISAVISVIMILSGFLVSGYIAGDDLAGPHLPSAAVIASGNFPVKDLNLPDISIPNHYGQNLFYAAISKITGFSVLFAFRLCVFIFSGVIFLLIFNIAKLFLNGNRPAFLVAFVAFFGGGFRFIYGFSGAVTLYQKFFLHQPIEHPFKFLGDMWSGLLTGPLVENIFITWGALGWSLVLAIIYFYLTQLKGNRRFWAIDILLIILMAVLALHFEMAFICLFFAILISPFLYYLKEKDRQGLKASLKRIFLILAPVALFVLFQGGTITEMLKNLFSNRLSYGTGLGMTFLKHPFSLIWGDLVIPFYGKIFIMNFGLTYFLIIPALICLSKKYFKSVIFLAAVSVPAFLIPLFFSFNWVWQGTLDRFLRFGNLIWALLVGLFLVILLLLFKNKSFFFKFIIYICLVVMCLEGVFFLISKPWYRRDAHFVQNTNFLARLRPQTPVESSAYNWVKHNTAGSDYFLVFADQQDLTEPGILENFRFVLFAQRLAPVHTVSNNYIWSSLSSNDSRTPIYQRLIKDCRREDVLALKYHYFWVDKNWPDNLELKCLAQGDNNFKLVFSIKNDSDFVRIYRVN